MNIPDRWISKLDMLPPKDFKTLVMAILRGESEPEIAPKYQPIASDIYADIGRLKRDNEYQKKHRLKSDSNLTVRRMSDECQTNVRQEEKREESPPDAGAGACVKGGVRSRRDRFEELWKIYPKKTGKTNAFADYERAVKDGVTDEEIRDGINRYCEYIRTGQLTDRYILGGSTYFHQRRWQDVYNPPDNGRGGMSQEDWEEMNAVFG